MSSKSSMLVSSLFSVKNQTSRSSRSTSCSSLTKSMDGSSIQRFFARCLRPSTMSLNGVWAMSITITLVSFSAQNHGLTSFNPLMRFLILFPLFLTVFHFFTCFFFFFSVSHFLTHFVFFRLIARCVKNQLYVLLRLAATVPSDVISLRSSWTRPVIAHLKELFVKKTRFSVFLCFSLLFLCFWSEKTSLVRISSMPSSLKYLDKTWKCATTLPIGIGVRTCRARDCEKCFNALSLIILVCTCVRTSVGLLHSFEATIHWDYATIMFWLVRFNLSFSLVLVSFLVSFLPPFSFVDLYFTPFIGWCEQRKRISQAKSPRLLPEGLFLSFLFSSFVDML